MIGRTALINLIPRGNCKRYFQLLQMIDQGQTAFNAKRQIKQHDTILHSGEQISCLLQRRRLIDHLEAHGLQHFLKIH